MNERIKKKKLTEQASLLPPIERAELVEGISQSLERRSFAHHLAICGHKVSGDPRALIRG